MANLLLRGRVTEKDIEDLFYYRLMNGAKIEDRQGTFRNAGRLSLSWSKIILATSSFTNSRKGLRP